MHHEFKALFFRALRGAIFIMNESDVDNVRCVLDSKPHTSWNKNMAFDFSYIAKRVRRRIPQPKILYNRVKAVFNFFKDKNNSKTNVRLFYDKNKHKFENMMKMIKKGYASDPQHISMYIRKTEKNGRPMVDKDGLQ